MRIAEHQFVHGTIFLDDRLSGMLYFEDINKGMMAVCWSINPPETKYVRFTGRPDLRPAPEAIDELTADG